MSYKSPHICLHIYVSTWASAMESMESGKSTARDDSQPYFLISVAHRGPIRAHERRTRRQRGQGRVGECLAVDCTATLDRLPGLTRATAGA